MNKIFKTASIITSGIIVGALVKKFALPGFNISSRKSVNESVKSVKILFSKSSFSDEINNHFI